MRGEGTIMVPDGQGQPSPRMNLRMPYFDWPLASCHTLDGQRMVTPFI
jgi:hypothetical protein